MLYNWSFQAIFKSSLEEEIAVVQPQIVMHMSDHVFFKKWLQLVYKMQLCNIFTTASICISWSYEPIKTSNKKIANHPSQTIQSQTLTVSGLICLHNPPPLEPDSFRVLG